LEAKKCTQEYQAQCCRAGAELESEEILNVVEDALALFDCVKNGCKVVVCQNHICGFFRNIGTQPTHGDADICFLERGRVVHTIASHCHDVAS
jgi:hypothetical protein